MAKTKKTKVVKKVKKVEKKDPNELLRSFLIENKIKLKVGVTNSNDGVAFIGSGFVLTDKPLIKIVAEYE